MIARLLDMLVASLREQLGDAFHLEAAGREDLPVPAIHLGGPPSDFDDEETFPCVVVTWSGCDDGEKDAEIAVDLILCVHGKAGPSAIEEWTAGITDRLRRILRDTGILGGEYERQLPVRARRPDPQREHYRYAVVVLSTSWRRPWPPQPLEGFE